MDRKVLLACFLIVIGTVSWRRGVYYSGNFDSVVLIKAMLACVALSIAVSSGPSGRRVPPPFLGALWFLGVYVAVSVFGAWTSGDVLASSILATRLLLTAAVILFLVRAYSALIVMRGLAIAMTTVGLCGVAVGLNSLSSGRLEGGVPPLTPNELALLCGVGLIFVLWRCFDGRGRWFDVAIVALLAGIVWATGSRTGLAVLLASVLVMLVQVRRLPLSVFAGIVVALPVAFYAIASTTLISDFLGRGGTRGITTLSSRTIAWQAAVDLPQTAWQQLFGGGLSLKRIPVPARWWSEQGLDSSWISGLVQVGIVGVILLLVWTLVTGFRAARAPTPERLLWSGLLSYVVTRSALESGLFDATPAFLVFFLIALLPRAMQHSLARDSAPSRHGTLLSPSHRVPASSGSVF